MTNDSNSGNKKRFTIDEKMLGYIGEFVLDNGVMIKELSDVVRLLNELNNENQQCKDYNAKLYANGMNNDRQCLKIIRELEKENTHIKQTIQDMINTERTAIGKSVLKQLWEAIQ